MADSHHCFASAWKKISIKLKGGKISNNFVLFRVYFHLIKKIFLQLLNHFMLLFNQSWPQPAYDISSNPVINGIFRSGQRGQRRLRPPRLQSGADRVATRLPLIHHTPISRVGTTSPPYIFSKRTQYDCCAVTAVYAYFQMLANILNKYRYCGIYQSWARENTAATTWPCFQASVVWFSSFTIFVVATPSRHRDIIFCRIFSFS